MHQKKRCTKCNKATPIRITVKVNDATLHICEECAAKERAAMLADPKHPAWKTYNALSGLLGASDDRRN